MDRLKKYCEENGLNYENIVDETISRLNSREFGEFERMKEYENVQSLTKPISTDDFFWFIENFPSEVFYEVLDNMENTAGLKKKYMSARLTALNWLARRGWKPREKVAKFTVSQMREYLKSAPEQARMIAKLANPMVYLKAQQ